MADYRARVSVTLARAFPSDVRQSVDVALSELPPPAYPPVGSITSSNSRKWADITIGGERIEIPSRIYNQVPSADLAPTASPVAVAVACLYTRHHDGFIRQRALHHVVASDFSWTVPFVVQLLGEYVIEICEDIQRFVQRDLPQRPAMLGELRSFAVANGDFISLTQQRASSYWACYYRSSYVYRDAYPGLIALKAMLGAAA